MIVIGAQTRIYIRVRRVPLTTATSLTHHARNKQVGGIIREKCVFFAVQTLRNQVMAATFLASTVILISLGSFGAAFRPGVFMEVSHTLNLLGTKTKTLWMFGQISMFASRLVLVAVLYRLDREA